MRPLYGYINKLIGCYLILIVIDGMSACRAGYLSKQDSEILKTRFNKRVAFVPTLLPKLVIKI